MVVTAPGREQAHKGIRPINLNRDVPQVLKLLELCFGTTVDSEGQDLFTTPTVSDQSPTFLWRLNPAAYKLSQGYVWEENGRIVGNATVLNSKQPGRFLVVNVAVHPDYRRRGIARQLMNGVADMVRRRNGREILLQVVKDNTAAVNLYKSMQYETIGSMTAWLAPTSRLLHVAPAAGHQPPPPIYELRRHEWRDAYLLDLASLHPDLNWPEPIDPDTYKTGFWQRLSDFFNSRHIETWVIPNAQNQLVGLGSIVTEWGRSHYVNVRVHPRWRGQLERPLLAKLIRRLTYLPRRNVRIEHPDDDLVMTELLRQANFQPRRTLTHMRLTFPDIDYFQGRQRGRSAP